MSLVLNMIGGGGSFTATDAILRVQAPAGGVVTISKGATTKTDYGHENMTDPTVYDYYFIIHQSQFDSLTPWTVSATANRVTNTQTIIINASDEYDLVFKCLVPDGYQAVEYIGCTGTQYIDCDIIPALNFSFNGKFAYTSNTADPHVVSFGRSSGGSYRLTIDVTEKKYSIYIASTSNNVTLSFASIVVNQFFDVSYEQSTNFQTVTIGGSTQTAAINTSEVSQIDYCYLCRYRSTNSWNNGPGRIASLVMYNNGTMVRDFRPCYRVSDSVAGLWDTISNTLFTNAGTGTFAVGSDLN